MARWYVSFDGHWQGSFHDFGEAAEWAEEVAATGRTVDVVERRFFLRRKLVAVFPESERVSREAVWAAWTIPWVWDGGGIGFGGGDFGGGGGGGDGGGGGGC
jgi:hypothetical protein